MRLSLFVLMLTSGPTLAGVYYSKDRLNPLPAQWRGFLPDHRLLRQCAVIADAGRNTLRDRAADDALKLETILKTRALTVDEVADLGALYLRLGIPLKAIAILRPAARANPDHFRTQANLGTAWQLAGDLEQASIALEEAVRLAPSHWQAAEKLHLKLVRLRLKEPRGSDGLDNLFGIQFVGESGKPEANALAAAGKKQLPENSLQLVQQLAVWLPGDARLLWQLAELANASGDVRTAANILEGCITELGLKSEEARRRRQLYRTAAEELAKSEDHKGHRGTLKFTSARVFERILDESQLPKVDPKGINELPWAALAETTVSKKFEISLLKYVQELDGKSVTLTGFMVPSGMDQATEFLFVEFAVGCWFCESPGVTQVIAVELKDGQTTDYTRTIRSITGTLNINRNDPEGYLFIIKNATIRGAE